MLLSKLPQGRSRTRNPGRQREPVGQWDETFRPSFAKMTERYVVGVVVVPGCGCEGGIWVLV